MMQQATGSNDLSPSGPVSSKPSQLRVSPPLHKQTSQVPAGRVQAQWPWAVQGGTTLEQVYPDCVVFAETKIHADAHALQWYCDAEHQMNHVVGHHWEQTVDGLCLTKARLRACAFSQDISASMGSHPSPGAAKQTQRTSKAAKNSQLWA